MRSDGPFLIGMDNIQEMLSTILADSIVLDNRFIIKGINQNVLDLLGYTRNELLGKGCHLFCRRQEPRSIASKGFSHGFLRRKKICFADKRKYKSCRLHIRILYGPYQRHQ